MIRSMTGYGAAEAELKDGQLVRIEIRTVNHRHLNVSVRLPGGWDRLEKPVTDVVRATLERGHVHVSIGFDRTEAPTQDLPELDLERARYYADAAGRLTEELSLTGPLHVNALMRFPDVFRSSRGTPDPPEMDALRPALDEALGGVLELREKEGERLEEALVQALAEIDKHLDTVETLAPARLVRERDRLRDQIRALTESTPVDEDRLAREIAYLAEKWDVQEELVRFRSHVALFRETLAPAREERAGKRLSFIVQEMNREANTIGAKANDAEIASAAVAMKEQLEQLREQIENVE